MTALSGAIIMQTIFCALNTLLLQEIAWLNPVVFVIIPMCFAFSSVVLTLVYLVTHGTSASISSLSSAVCSWNRGRLLNDSFYRQIHIPGGTIRRS